MKSAEILKKIFYSAKQRGQIAFIPLVVPEYPDPKTFQDLSRYLRLLKISAIETLFTINNSFSSETGTLVRQVALKYTALAPELIAVKLRSFKTKICVIFGKVNRNSLHQLVGNLAQNFNGLIFDNLECSPVERYVLAQRFNVTFIPTIPFWASRIEIRNEIKGCDGFVYLMCSSSTGGEFASYNDIRDAIKRVRSQTSLPIGCAFGIKTPQDVCVAQSAGADGVIIGSALLRALKEETARWRNFIKMMKHACRIGI